MNRNTVLHTLWKSHAGGGGARGPVREIRKGALSAAILYASVFAFVVPTDPK